MATTGNGTALPEEEEGREVEEEEVVVEGDPNGQDTTPSPGIPPANAPTLSATATPGPDSGESGTTPIERGDPSSTNSSAATDPNNGLSKKTYRRNKMKAAASATITSTDNCHNPKGFQRGLRRTTEELEAKLTTTYRKNKKKAADSTAITSTDNCHNRKGFQRGLRRTTEELEAKQGKAASRLDAVTTQQSPPSSKGFQRGLRRTTEELEAKQNANRIVSAESGSKRAPTKILQRGLRRSPEELDAKRNARNINFDFCNSIKKESETYYPENLSPIEDGAFTLQEIDVDSFQLQHHSMGAEELETNDPESPINLQDGNSEPSLQEIDVDSLELQHHSMGDEVLETHDSENPMDLQDDNSDPSLQEIDVDSFQLPQRSNGIALPHATSRTLTFESTLQPQMSNRVSTIVSNSDLAVAREILDEDDSSLMQAVEVDPEELERKAVERKKNKECILTGACIIVVSFAVLFGGIFGHLRTSKDATIASKDTTVALAPVPTPAPTSAPSGLPSLAPSSVFDLMLQNDLTGNTLEKLENSSTPQWKALDWLSRHPNITDMEEWRKRQLFALVSFFYAMEGPNWREEARERWLQYDTHECYWYSSAYGSIDEEGNYKDLFTDIFSAASWPLCNGDNEFLRLVIGDMALGGFKPFIPPEISLLTSMRMLTLGDNKIGVSIGTFLPTELYLMANLTSLNLHTNRLSGSIPSGFGRMTQLTVLSLNYNSLTGTIPNELKLMTSLEWLLLGNNSLTGSFPDEMQNLKALNLFNNSLTGQLPADLAATTGMTELNLDNNRLTGTIHRDLETLVLNGSLSSLMLTNNSFSGTIPEGLCTLGRYDASNSGGARGKGLAFDCNDMLCGCCWCPCPNNNYSTYCQTSPLYQYGWPGAFPTPPNSSNLITINILTDSFPGETSFEWSTRNESGFWHVLESEFSLARAKSVHSYTMDVASGSIYRLLLQDLNGDGVCCQHGFGWFTITNSTTSSNTYAEGTVMWYASGQWALQHWLDVFIWIDMNGHAQLVEYLPGEGYALGEEKVIVVPENVSQSETISFLPSRDDEAWPGHFPTPINSTNVITINIRFPANQNIYDADFSFLAGPDSWEQETGLIGIGLENWILSLIYEVQSDAVYRLHLFDKHGSGIPFCCAHGFGWFSITNSIPSSDHAEGSVIWEARGDALVNSLEVFVWVDPDGHAHHVEYLPGAGYALPQDEYSGEGAVIVFPGM